MTATTTLAPRAVHAVVDMPLHHFDSRTWAHMFHPEHLGLVDPFIGVDAFSMPHHYFLPHPHGGMSAVTLLLDHSPGGVVNRDSWGDHSTIAPGDLHWTQAGSGIIHEETPSQPGQPAVGLQIFVNMARARKQDPAAVFKVDRAHMPVWQQGGVAVKVAAGSFLGLHSPITQDARWATTADLLDIHLAPGAQAELPLADAKNGFFIVVSGALQVAGVAAQAPQAVVLAPSPSPSPSHASSVGSSTESGIALHAGPEGAHVVLLAGVPLREPVVPYGPFVGNTRADILAYSQAYQSGAMGQLEASFTRSA